MVDPLPDAVYRAIVKRTGAPFVLVDLDGTIVDAGDAIDAVVGWTPAEVVGRSLADFLDAADFELALAGMAEIDSVDRIGTSVPIVVPVKGPDGRERHVEVAALPLHDVADRGLFALRLRCWDSQRHLTDFIRTLLEGARLGHALGPLTRSLAASMEAAGAAVHHGFDGTTFAGVVGSWPEAADLPLAGPPWTDALAAESLLEVRPSGPAVEAIGAATGWLLPVRPQSNAPLAVLSIWRDRPDPPSIGHRRAFGAATDYVELALVRAAEHERLVHMARHDSLTGVKNRATFRDHMAAALARGETDLAIGFCDLDGFKLVNDKFGHAVGDSLLVEVAERIRATLRAGDEVARVGGDEFTVLWRNIPDGAAADAVAARVLATADTPFTVAEGRTAVGISIGYVLAQPGDTADSLLAAADAALYRSKQAGGGRAIRLP